MHDTLITLLSAIYYIRFSVLFLEYIFHSYFLSLLIIPLIKPIYYFRLSNLWFNLFFYCCFSTPVFCFCYLNFIQLFVFNCI